MTAARRDETRAPSGVSSRAPFGWYGSKGRLAARIAKLATAISHRVYIEPYAGSAAVLFAKARVPVEIINDANGQVVNFFRVLRDYPAELARACQLTPYARGEYQEIDLETSEHNGHREIEQARRFWVRSVQSFNNAGAGRRVGWAVSSARGSNEARSASALASELEAIAVRLAGVYVEQADALKLIRRHSAADVLIYADPPYLAETRTGFDRSCRGDYRHEASASHHVALAEALQASSAAVLISGYDHPLYRHLYESWHRTEIRVAKPSANHAAAGSRHAIEVIWSNRPLAIEATLFDGITLTAGVTKLPPPARPCDETRGLAPCCQVCGAQITGAATGRPRSYCSRSCQARAYRARARRRG